MKIGDKYRPIKLLAETKKVKYPEPKIFTIVELKENIVIIRDEDGILTEQPYWFIEGFCKKEGA